MDSKRQAFLFESVTCLYLVSSRLAVVQQRALLALLKSQHAAAG